MLTAVFLPIVAVAAAATATPQADVTAALADSAAGWNAGDLDRFMAVYADDAIYAAGDAIARGKAEIAARYARISRGGAARGGSCRCSRSLSAR